MAIIIASKMIGSIKNRVNYVIVAFYSCLILGNNPSWRCAIQPNTTQNVTSAGNGSASECRVAGDIKVGDDYYEARCNMDRSLWVYSKDKDYSIVTEV